MRNIAIASRTKLPPALTARERADVESYFARSRASGSGFTWASLILPLAAALFLLMSLGLARVPAPAGIASLLAPVGVAIVG